MAATTFEFKYTLGDKQLTETYTSSEHTITDDDEILYCCNGKLDTSYNFSTATLTYANTNKWTGAITAFASGAYNDKKINYLDPAGVTLDSDTLTIKVNKAATTFAFAPQQNVSDDAEINNKWQDVLSATYTLEDTDIWRSPGTVTP